MIGLLDRDRTGLVAAALERAHALCPLDGMDAALDAILRGRVEALIVECAAGGQQLGALFEVARARGVPVLVVSRERGVAAAVETLRAGASDYLSAPFEYATLQVAVERLLDASLAGTGSGVARRAFVTQDPGLLATLALARSVAASDATVLIEGESGTGKELLARFIHEASPRRSRELVSINCAALPAGLLESELFGHERGAFTGAFTRVIGKFELAEGTTLLLDEIGELELGLQAKLLRVIQEKQVQRIGAPRPVSIDFRLVATTNRNLADAVRAGEFREDLYYRLNVLPVPLKPLRERAGDLDLLIDRFLARSLPAPQLSEGARAALRAHSWPGNVRELENAIARLCLTHPGRVVNAHEVGLGDRGRPGPLSPELPGEHPPTGTLRDMERWLIVRTLARLEGNRTRAARELGISLRTLRNKINEYYISEPETLPRSGTGQRMLRQAPERL